MIRSIGDVISSTYSQTLNGRGASPSLLRRGRESEPQVGHAW